MRNVANAQASIDDLAVIIDQHELIERWRTPDQFEGNLGFELNVCHIGGRILITTELASRPTSTLTKFRVTCDENSLMKVVLP
mmetsp:Transcript_11762/g.24058  ORF Transcript_11762/g.24058 Transcript_11762/m.24058 type:complete len:83 (+) Transcript_11762:84-332(+)